MDYFQFGIEPLGKAWASRTINGRSILCGLLALSLVACNSSDGNGGNGDSGSDDDNGGNGGGSTLEAPVAPVLSFSPESIKSFSFDWDDVADETEYRLLENPDGMSVYNQVATITADSTSHDLDVFLPGRINASYILQACNSIGCSDSAPVYISGTLTEAVGYLKASNTGAGDRFGFSVALSGDGNTLAVGAYGEDSSAGGAYVFTRNGANWAQQALVKAANPDARDYFGYSLALSGNGDTLTVGAPFEDSGAEGSCAPSAVCDIAQSDDSSSSSGAAYVFIRNAGTWSQQAYVKATNTDTNDRFGHSIALADDGNTLAVSAHLENGSDNQINGKDTDNGATNSGAVYVLTRNGDDWSHQAYIKASNTDPLDEFGFSIALANDGDTLAVGAYREDSDTTGIGVGDEGDVVRGFDSGAVYVFTRDEGAWSQQAYIKASNTSEGDEFGYSVALSGDGNTLVAGAHKEQNNSTGIDGDQSTSFVRRDSGAVYVFTRSQTTWSQQAYVKASNTGAGDHFGYDVALSGNGNTLVVGAYSEGSDATGIGGDESNNLAGGSGAVYVFSRSGMNWSQQAYVKASNTETGDQFGSHVALASDGNTLAVGANGEDSMTTGVGGDQDDNSTSDSGAVYLY